LTIASAVGTPDNRALSIIAEELGRSLLPCPFLSTIALALPLASLLNSNGELDSLLSDMVEGQAVVSVAFHETAAGIRRPDDINTIFRQDVDRFLVTGRKISVLDGAVADSFLVVARQQNGVGIFLIDRDAEGVSVESHEPLDLSQHTATIVFQNAPAVFLGDQSSGWSKYIEAQSIAAFLVAAEQMGGAERCVEMALDYVKERHQFGRAIGSFQSVKHSCANMAIGLVMVRAALETVLRTTGSKDADWLAATSNLRSVASEEFAWIAEENLQLHGGLGFTWESDCHLYLRRARFCEALLGGTEHYRDWYVTHLDL
jgi:alkylation response protein AidB-like acyl-CoA dehydrogenase